MEKLDVLDNRITDLGEHFEREKASILQQIDERGRELTDMLNKFKVTFEDCVGVVCGLYFHWNDICVLE